MIYLSATPTHGTDYIVGDPNELAEVKWASLAEVTELMPDMYLAVRRFLEDELRGDQL